MSIATGMMTGERVVSAAEERRVIIASSVSTIFEWYDFHLFAILAPFLAALFFPPGNRTAALLGAFGAYAVRFLARPFGALIFGPIGDLVGRKYTFLVTIVVMGVASILVGFLPTYASLGFAAPVILMLLWFAQGLALGGGFGGAAIYVAEQAPDDRRGYATSWIQTTPTVGVLMALIVIGLCRYVMDAKAFATWGWRIPFWFSIPLLLMSIYIRVRLSESPLFRRMKAQGKRSKTPLKDSFFKYPNNKYVALALLGATAGQGVVWYTSHLYALFFLLIYLRLDFIPAYTLIGLSLILGTPFFPLFGALSDRMGRKKVILAGCIIAALTYFPLFRGLMHFVNPDLEAYRQRTPIEVAATNCNLHVFVGPWTWQTACDRAKDFLGKSGLSFTSVPAVAGRDVVTKIGNVTLEGWDPVKYSDALKTTGYPPKADTTKVNWVMAEIILVIMVIYVTMVCGPIAAFLVELFPAKIRYTSMSLPYDLGNSWFGGMLPLLAPALVAWSGNIYYGLWYPIWVSIIAFVIGVFMVRETRHVQIHAEH